MPPHDDGLIARATVTVAAAPGEVWSALVEPAAIKQYMFGTTVESDWSEGGSIVWKGDWQGRAYEDKGVILRIEPERVLQYSHFSPLTGLPDRPENYHMVTVEVAPEGTGTRISLAQDGNGTDEARGRSEEDWKMMLDSLRRYVDGGKEAAA